jgi:hypothetical protein
MGEIYINHVAVLVCGALSLVIGGLWWSPLLFSKVWQQETGLTDNQLRNVNVLKTFGLSFLLALIASYNLAFFLGSPDTNWQSGIIAGLLASVWAIVMYIIISLFEQRSLKLILINSGYVVLYFAIIGFVLGIWR